MDINVFLGNWYGISVKDNSSRNVDRSRNLTKQLEVDGLGGTDVRMNRMRTRVEE